MGKLIRDEELEQLVRELNDGNERRQPLQAAPQAVPEGNPLEHLLLEMTQRGASDLLLIAGNPPIARLGGRLIRIDEQILDGDDVSAYFAAFLTPRLHEQLR